MDSKDCSTGCCGECGNPPQQTRRSALSWLLGAGVTALLASFFYPVLRFLNPPHITEAAVNEVAAGKVEDLKPNSGKIIKFGNKPALLVRVSETEFKAFSAVCTHLNCTAQYQDSTRQIWCACSWSANLLIFAAFAAKHCVPAKMRCTRKMCGGWDWRPQLSLSASPSWPSMH
jgi:hypothetical protein